MTKETNKKRRCSVFIVAFIAMLVMPFVMACGSKTGAVASAGDYEVTLPKNYETESRNYPVIYLLPQDGYRVDDSGIAEMLLEEMDVILVRPAFAEEAALHGTMEALVKEVDASYRTIADKKYRAVIGTGTGGYLAYILGFTDGKDSVLKESSLFSSIISIRGDFVSEANPWYATYGDVFSYAEKMHKKNETVFDGFYTYIDAPVKDAWTNMEGSTNDLGALFIGYGTQSSAHEFTVREGEFSEEFLKESVSRVAERLTKYMSSDMAEGTITLKRASLPDTEKTAGVGYSIAVSEEMNKLATGEVSAETVISVLDPLSGAILTEVSDAIKINGAGTYTGEAEVENLVNGSYSTVKLTLKVCGMTLELASAPLSRSQGAIIDGDYQKIDLSGDWYFNYTGEKKEVDAATLKPEEYKIWSVVQPGLGNWAKGYGNINEETVKGPAEYFEYMIVGNGYYVKEFEVPENFDSQDVILSIGYIDDRCEVFVNGKRVGATGMDEKGKSTGETTWAEYSVFEIEPELIVRGGINTVTVRAWNDTPYGAGGWYAGPIGLYSRTAFENQDKTVGTSSRFIEEVFDSSYAASALGETGKVENEYLVYLPKDYDAADRYYPTMYLLHQFNSDHTSYKTDQIDQILDKAMEDGLLDEMIVVVPNSEENSWWTGDWEKMLTYELIPLIDGKYRTIRDARYRLTAGCSMGGQGAFAVALRNPEYFTGAVSFFGAFSYGEASSPNHIAAEESAEYMDYYTMYFICGNQDSYGFGVPAIELHQLLEEKGVEHGFFIENGGHDSAFYVPYFIDGLSYARNHMYQSEDAVEKTVTGKLAVDTKQGIVVNAEFEALPDIEAYFHTMPDSSYTHNGYPRLSIPLIIQVIQDEKIVCQYTKSDMMVSAEKMQEEISFDITEGVDAAKEYTVVFKAAIFDRVVTLDSVTITTN